MIETTTSPLVPIESITVRLPTNRPKNSPLTQFSRLYTAESPYDDGETSTETSLLKLCRSRLSHDEQSLEAHSCPHVLVSDDDPFQEFYYRVLFEKSLDFDGMPISKTDFRFEIRKSAENLLDRYLKLRTCSCELPQLIITDYDMGTFSINGFEMIAKLRDYGFKGPIILRTSETQEKLSKVHRNFKEVFEKDTKNYYLEKGALNKVKEFIQSLLKQEMEAQQKD